MISKDSEKGVLKGASLPSAHEAPGSPGAPQSPNGHPQQIGPPHSVSLGVYEGPLDLLLDLIRRQEINIYDIPIAEITDQYLEYLRKMEERDLDVEGDFLFMAATLIHIKSRMLLPAEPSTPEGEAEDPRAELVHRLLEHEKFKNAAQMLQTKRTLEDATWSLPGIDDFQEMEDDPGLAVNLFDLMSAFHEVIERAKRRQPIEIEGEEVSVTDMMERVKNVLSVRDHPVELEDLFVGLTTRRSLIALFLGLLEMVRLRAVQLRQRELLAPITVHKSKKFDDVLKGVATDWLEKGLEENYG